ncbi:FAD-binding oxidoreductase [Sphingomonas sp. dw_22]|uniref:NAD(P)/FAD-dependent oxidoreductase n=1 Tax=Sphingomonas sp. dw_22 TaxID=2721175 RepID=UPI001BD398ED|nr:FAD-binding oxidoreductase [Sphingomonas sp. dw_22]
MPIAKISPERALVIGGGIVGLSVAIALQGKGISTILVAPSGMRGTASWGNAGHIATEQVEPLASAALVKSAWRRLFWRGGALSLPPGEIAHWLPFSLRLLLAARPSGYARGRAALEAALAQAMPAWRRLVAVADAPGLLIERGHFIAWESEASAEKGRAHWLAAPTGSARVRDVTPAELAQLRALVSAPIAGAIRFEGSGQIADPDLLADALEATFLRLGGARRSGIATLRRTAGGAVEAISADGALLTSGPVVIAAGAASGALLRPLGHAVPIIAERGYHIQSDGAGWPEDLPPVVFEDRSLIVTRFRSGLRAASFVEFGSIATPPDARKWARLRAHAAAIGLPFAGAVHEWIGARPTLPDYLPAIGRSSAAPNLFYAFGHQHLGLTLGPVTGEAVAALIAGETPELDLAPFDLRRFGGS